MEELSLEEIEKILRESGPNLVIEIPEKKKVGCLTDDEMLRLVDRELREQERSRVQRHMRGCTDCQSMSLLIRMGGHLEGDERGGEDLNPSERDKLDAEEIEQFLREFWTKIAIKECNKI